MRSMAAIASVQFSQKTGLSTQNAADTDLFGNVLKELRHDREPTLTIRTPLSRAAAWCQRRRRWRHQLHLQLCYFRLQFTNFFGKN